MDGLLYVIGCAAAKQERKMYVWKTGRQRQEERHPTKL